ncbi:MAG: nicotinate-nucleotide adenylyltransferase [Chloroflexi bacterium]|nr:nicotinate-nucleotide adenylyltransferase [Chloroflexota bacterium]
MERLGVYGGTFDPVHLGHLSVARSVREAYDLSRVLFIPARQSPLRDPPRASAPDRLAMIQRAIEGMPGFEASAIDIERPGPSYMVDTLRELTVRHPGADLFLVLGADALGELPAWREADGILAAAQIIAVPRPGHAAEIPPEVLALHPGADRRIHRHRMPPVDIAASRIRASRARGRSVDAWVPPAVAEYIAARRLYSRGRTDESGAI